MTTIDIETIDERIKTVRIEQAVLQQNFDAMVARFNQQQAEHNQQVVNGQNRFQQLAGMLAELTHLREELLKTESNGEAPAESNRMKKEKK